MQARGEVEDAAGHKHKIKEDIMLDTAGNPIIEERTPTDITGAVLWFFFFTRSHRIKTRKFLQAACNCCRLVLQS